MMELALGRDAMVQRGRRLEYFTVAWNSLEGIVAVLAGVFAGSISLVGFGVDSFIEVTSGAALLWRLSLDAETQQRERIEKLTLKMVGVCWCPSMRSRLMTTISTSAAMPTMLRLPRRTMSAPTSSEAFPRLKSSGEENGERNYVRELEDQKRQLRAEINDAQARIKYLSRGPNVKDQGS